jgi:hypothetical protein
MTRNVSSAFLSSLLTWPWLDWHVAANGSVSGNAIDDIVIQWQKTLPSQALHNPSLSDRQGRIVHKAARQRHRAPERTQ